MKSKVLLSVLASFCLIATVHAQVNKGAVLVGGNIGYNKNKTDYETSPEGSSITTFNITPAAGIATKQNLVLGLDLNFQEMTQKNPYATTFIRKKENFYGGGFFIRRYVPIISRLYVIAQGRAGFNIYKAKTDNHPYYAPPRIDEKGWNGSLSFTPGISFALNNKLHLESGFNNLASIQYQKIKSDQHFTNGGSTSETFSAGINLENSSTFYLGFRILINGKG